MSRYSTFKKVGVAACLVIGLGQPALASDAGCTTTAAADAFSVRDLQSRLMVAGLACGQRASYNKFVGAHEGKLATAGQRLISYFRENGNGVRDLDRHVTLAANAAARTHGLNRDAYCAEAAQLFNDLLDASSASLVHIARRATFTAVPKPTLCMAKAPTEADAFVVSESE